MFVCVVPLYWPSSRDLLYVKCLCVLSRYIGPVVEICYMLNILCVFSLSQPSSRDLLYVKCRCVFSRYLSPVVEICNMLNVCVCFLVISAQSSSRDLLYVKYLCVVPLYWPSRRDLDYPLWDVPFRINQP